MSLNSSHQPNSMSRCSIYSMLSISDCRRRRYRTALTYTDTQVRLAGKPSQAGKGTTRKSLATTQPTNSSKCSTYSMLCGR